MNLIKSYYLLCKPNVVYMMLICAFVGMLLAEDSVTSISKICIALFGIALCSGSAAAINQVIDRKADAAMTRTDQRPLPQGELSAFHASCFAFVIGVLGALILYFFINTLTMVLTLASLIGYAFIYTVYLKRATPQNIVIGGLAGAAPPLLGVGINKQQHRPLCSSISINHICLDASSFLGTSYLSKRRICKGINSYASSNTWCGFYETPNCFIHDYFIYRKHSPICSSYVW
jgi:4-hydroxybenzoate polyprenyltransferase